MVVDVAGDEDTVDLRAGFVVDDEIALVVDIQPVAERVGVRSVADSDEEAFHVDLVGLAGLRVTQSQARDFRVAKHFVHGRVQPDRDLGVRDGAVDHDLAASEGIPPVEEMDLRREPRQEGRLFERGVAATDDRDLLVPEEEPVARRAGTDTATAQPGLALEPKPQSGGARGDDDRLPPVFRAAGPDPKRPRREVDPIDVDVDDLRAESLRLGAEGGHQLGALDAVREARIVLDVARDHELTAGGGACQHDRLEIRPCGVDRGGQSGWARADDDELRFGPSAVPGIGPRAARRGDRGGRIAACCRGRRRAGYRGRRWAKVDGDRIRRPAAVTREVDREVAERF